MTGADAAALAFRLFGVGAIVFLLPGLALLARVRTDAPFAERLVLAFGISYSWILALSVLLPVAGWTVDTAAWLTIVVSGVLLIASWRFFAFRWTGTGAALGLVVVTLAASAWFIEPPITGEEALDLTSISRFADGGAITFENTSLLPNTRPVYLFQPYQLGMGMVARWSGTDPLVALVKIRPLFVLLSLVFVYALLGRLAPTHAHARAAFAVVLVFIALDVSAWASNGLFPLVRRGSFSAGLLVPALMTMTVVATRRIRHSGDVFVRRLSLAVVPILLIAALSTHPLEVATLLCFIGALVLVVMSGLDEWGDRRAAAALAICVAVAATGYLVLHSQMVPEVAAEEREQKTAARAAFVDRSAGVTAMIAGNISEEGYDLLAKKIPESIAGVIGVPALLLTAMSAPTAAIILTISTVPLLLMYASPGGVLLLSLAISPDTVQDVNAYFGLLGLIALALGLAGVARLRLAFAAAAVAVAWMAGPPLAEWLVHTTSLHPAASALAAAAWAVLALAIALRRSNVVVDVPLAPAAVAIAAALAVPFVLGGRPSGERVTIRSAVAAAAETPRVLDWASYYDLLRTTLLPPLSVPRTVFDELRSRLPPRQVLLANPQDSCSLTALLDAYCINPEAIYGHYFLGARPYHLRYVHSLDDRDGDWHPFFNMTWPPEEHERELLSAYRVSYLLADPDHAALIERKLQALNIDRTVEMRRDGYVLYHLGSVR